MSQRCKLFIIFFFALVIMDCSDKPFPFPEKYDPARDPFADVSAAVNIAQKSGQRILLKVGGDWCIWCHRLDDFIKANPEIDRFLQEKFIMLKINFSQENKNEQFLSQYPKIPGYPHLFVLEKNGSFLHSQDTGVLESGKSYAAEKIMEFLRQWAPGN